MDDIKCFYCGHETTGQDPVSHYYIKGEYVPCCVDGDACLDRIQRLALVIPEKWSN